MPVQITECIGTACNLVPIDLNGGSVYLSLYGTGFSQFSTENSTCLIAGQSIPIIYVGPQMQMAGLDPICPTPAHLVWDWGDRYDLYSRP